MARYGWFRIRILITGFFLTAFYSCAQSERLCVDGLRTPGYTEPHGDILIEYGNALDITCVLNDRYMKQHGENSSRYLYFMRDDEPIPSEMIDVINSSSIKLHVDNPPPSSSMYTCKIKNDAEAGAVCLNTVIVGTKPLPVTDFECIGYNYENLTCTWTRPENYVKTNYSLTYFFPGRAGRLLRHKCPEVSIHPDGKKMSCLWTVLSEPQYRQAQRTFYFELNMTNVFGNAVLNKTFLHFQHVLSGPPENLTYVNITTESVYLYWSVPIAMQAFPPGLQHRVMYLPEYGKKEWQFGGLVKTTTNNEMKDVYFNLTGLKYAHALYDIRVSTRSDAAEPDDESMWSKNSSITIRTMSKIPGASPRTNIGSFEIVSAGNSLNNTDMYVYWQQIKEEIKNGEDFSYYVTTRNSRIIEPVESNNAYAKFGNLSIVESYTFRIWSQNRAGRSEQESIVFVPKQSSRIGEPQSFTKIAFGNGKFELSWEKPKPRPFYDAPLQNYTIFWCTHDRDRPYQCSGYLDWVEIPNDKTVYNITVPDEKIYQFAISANSETSSSGMVWASCTVLHNKAIGKMENVDVTEVQSTYIVLGWKLECSDRIGSVTGFIVYYCVIVKPTITSCKGPEQNLTIVGDSTTNRANITGLKPYETYMLAVAVTTKHTIQTLKSNYVLQTTLEAAPSSPPKITGVKVTNSSITLVWQKPTAMNGKLKYYEIRYNARKIDANADLEEYTISNLLSYVDYNISLVACTVQCSAPSPIVVVKTNPGYPSKISQPGVTFQNDSFIVVEWDRPLHPRGRNDIYEVSFKEKLQYENRTVSVTNVTDLKYTIADCGGEGRYNTFYVSVRAINLIDGVRYEGPWSDELESYCRTSPNLWAWSLIPVCFILVLALFYLAKRMYFHCQEMRDVEVKLPSGLAPVVATDISLAHWGGQKVQEEQNHHPSADEELLLVKMSDSRNHLSGDSSGCSSGHESVTSSLESGTHLSGTSDSGTEQPRASSTEDLRKNSLRLRNVASARPTMNKGYITMPTDNVPPTTWSPKSAAPGSYCVLGVDSTPINSISPTYVPVSVPQPESTKLPYILPDASTQPSPYVVTGDVTKPSNSGYVALNSSNASIDQNPNYVMAGNKVIMPDLMRLDSVKSTELEEKPMYVQLADPSRKASPDSFSHHQPSIDMAAQKTGYVSVGDAPGPRPCIDPSKGYVPHRHFDTKTLKED